MIQFPDINYIKESIISVPHHVIKGQGSARSSGAHIVIENELPNRYTIGKTTCFDKKRGRFFFLFNKRIN